MKSESHQPPGRRLEGKCGRERVGELSGVWMDTFVRRIPH